MPDETTIHVAERAEVEEALSVWSAANPDASSARHRQDLAGWSLQEDARLFVARRRDGGAAGMLLSLQGRENDGAGVVAPGLRHITGVAVRPELQGLGIGRRLMLAAIADAEGSGSDRLTLWTEATNRRAQRLFESVGFRATGRVEVDATGVAMVLLERRSTG